MALVPFAVVVWGTAVAEATAIELVPMTVLATPAGARTAQWVDRHLLDGHGAGAGVMVQVAVRLWVLVRPSRGARSRATRTWTKSAGAVVGS